MFLYFCISGPIELEKKSHHGISFTTYSRGFGVSCTECIQGCWFMGLYGRDDNVVEVYDDDFIFIYKENICYVKM